MDEELSVDSATELERRKQRKARKKLKNGGDQSEPSSRLNSFRLSLCVMLGDLVSRRDLNESVQRAAYKFLNNEIQKLDYKYEPTIEALEAELEAYEARNKTKGRLKFLLNSLMSMTSIHSLFQLFEKRLKDVRFQTKFTPFIQPQLFNDRGIMYSFLRRQLLAFHQMDFQDLCALTETMKVYLRPLGNKKRPKVSRTLESIQTKPAAFEADNIFKSLSNLLENGSRILPHIPGSDGLEEGQNLSESVDRFQNYTSDRHRTSYLRSRLALRGGNLFPKMMKQLYRLSDFHGHGQRLDVEVLVAKAQSLAQIGAFQAFAETVIEFSRNVYSRSDKNFKNTFNFWLIVALQIFGQRTEEEVPLMLQQLIRSRRNQSQTPASSMALKLACLHSYFQYRLLSQSTDGKPLALLQKVLERAAFKPSYHLEFPTVLAQCHALSFSYSNFLFGLGGARKTGKSLLTRVLKEVDNGNSVQSANMENLLNHFHHSAISLGAVIKDMIVEPVQLSYLNETSTQIQMGRNSRFICQLAQSGKLALNLNRFSTFRRIIELMELLHFHDYTPLLAIKLTILKAQYCLIKSEIATASELVSRLSEKFFPLNDCFQQGFIHERIQVVKIKAQCYLAANRSEAARMLLQEQISLFKTLGAPVHQAQLQLILARIEKESLHLPEALLLVDKVMKFLAGSSDLVKAELYFLRAELCIELKSKVEDNSIRDSLSKVGLNCLNCSLPLFLETGDIRKLEQTYKLQAEMCDHLRLYKQRNIASYWSLQCAELIRGKPGSRLVSQFSGETVLRSLWEEVQSLLKNLPGFIKME